MHDCFKDILGVTEQENEEAIETAFKVWRRYFEVSLRADARKVLDQLEEEGKLGVVMLARPYHNDPGLNHEIMIEIQKKGYPIFSVDSLPQDPDILERLFGDEVRAGLITDPMDITDVWKNAYSENSSKKVWGAKYVARHPNLVAIDLSSFKCGHDAPIYNTIENIIEASNTPYFTFHDIDENKPTGSIKIRVETIDYFLARYQEHLQKRKTSETELQQMVAAYRKHLEASSAKAQEKLDTGGHIVFSGNDSRPASSGRNGQQSHEHDGDNWAPLSPEKLDGQDPLLVAGPLSASPPDEDGVAGSDAYDRIRAANTAGDLPEDEFGSGSASCGSPVKDYSLKAFEQQGVYNPRGQGRRTCTAAHRSS